MNRHEAFENLLRQRYIYFFLNITIINSFFTTVLIEVLTFIRRMTRGMYLREKMYAFPFKKI